MRRALCQSPAQDIPETGGDCCCEDADDPPGDTLVGEHHRPLFGPFVWDIGMRAAVSQVGGVRIYLGQWLTSTMPWVPRSACAGRRASQDMGPRRRTKPVYVLLRGGRAVRHRLLRRRLPPQVRRWWEPERGARPGPGVASWSSRFQQMGATPSCRKVMVDAAAGGRTGSRTR